MAYLLLATFDGSVASLDHIENSYEMVAILKRRCREMMAAVVSSSIQHLVVTRAPYLRILYVHHLVEICGN